MTPPDEPKVSITLGAPIISDFELRRRAEGRDWAEGYTQGELEDAQAKYDLRFPPDLVALLRERRPLIGYDWRTDDAEIKEILSHPFEGLLFDIEQNMLWRPEWGEKPGSPGERAEVLKAIIHRAPKLVPIISHRFIPSEPHEAGNPVFSIVQSDMIYYGADLEDYFVREFAGWSSRSFPNKVKFIRFWSDFVD